MSGIDKMSQFYSELISEGDKLTIRSYKNNFCVKMSPVKCYRLFAKSLYPLIPTLMIWFGHICQ